MLGWKLASQSLEVPTELFTLLRSFAELEDHLELDFYDVKVWLPSQNLLANLAFAMSFPDPRPLRSILLQSMEMDAVDDPSGCLCKSRKLSADQAAKQASPAQAFTEAKGENHLV